MSEGRAGGNSRHEKVNFPPEVNVRLAGERHSCMILPDPAAGISNIGADLSNSPRTPLRLLRLIALALAMATAGLASAQTPTPIPAVTPVIPRGGLLAPHPDPQPKIPRTALLLSAVLSAGDPQPLTAGVKWRVFDETAQADGSHRLVAQSSEAAPTLMLPDGAYIVHAAMGLAGMTKRVVISGQPESERLVLNAGGLRIVPMLGDQPINPAKLSIAIYVPEPSNSEAKLILPNARAGDIIGLPEGTYHVVSTLLDTSGTGSLGPNGIPNATNSVVSADLRVQAGKLTDATLRHRAAVMTLKLVDNPGGEALANSAFTILTPGGDVIRELIGAFPSVVLAEGEYVAVARHENRTFQTTFKVQSTQDRDVEILAR
ncbi:MAG TPA: hypothetical protein VKV77_04640 [Methylovirgula sp.]|nr:hypothetical protein [Methylovirgula sp.]